MLVNLIYARQYSFVGKNDGRKVEGCELHYSRAQPLASRDAADGNEKGARPSVAKGAIDLYRNVTTVPGQYELEVDPRQDGKGNTYLVAVSLRPAVAPSANGVHDRAPVATVTR